MKTYEVQPFSVTVGALVAALLLFACSSSGSGSSSGPTNPGQNPVVTTTPVTFYSDAPVRQPDPNLNVICEFHEFIFGVVAADTVITDISFEQAYDTGDATRDRILVDGVPVFGWGIGGLSSSSSNGFSVAPRMSLQHGILIPAGSTLTVETTSGNAFIALAGYTTS